MEIVQGKIKAWGDDGTVTIIAPVPDIERAILRKYDTVEIGFTDGRRISPEQRRKAYALIGEIADWQQGCRDAAAIEETKQLMKLEFLTNRQASLAVKMFSLADTDVTLAREFIDYLICFCIEYGVPTKEPLYARAEDIAKYVYACAIHKKCCVCGRDNADCHHEPPIGRGADREHMNHIGLGMLPLCRVHHTERHNKGADWFLQQYHLEPVPIDRKIAKVFHLKSQ